MNLEQTIKKFRRFFVPLLVSCLFFFFHQLEDGYVFVNLHFSRSDAIYTNNDYDYWNNHIYREMDVNPEDGSPVENATTKIILDWTGFFGSPMSNKWVLWFFRIFNEDQNFLSSYIVDCPFYNCEITNNRTLQNQSDAIVFHMRDFNMSDLPKDRLDFQYFAFFLVESPVHTYVNLRALKSYFNVTLTYRCVKIFFIFIWKFNAKH